MLDASSGGSRWVLDADDADRGLCLVFAVEVNQQRGQHFDVARLRRAAGIDAADAFNLVGEANDDLLGRGITATDEDVGFDRMIEVLEFFGAQVLECGDDPRAGKLGDRFLEGAIAFDAECDCTNTLFEFERAATLQTTLPSRAEPSAASVACCPL